MTVTRLKFLALAALLGLSAASVPATTQISAVASTADRAFLERLAGEWRGTGRVRPSPMAERERVNCRMSAEWSESSGSVSMDMTCKGVDLEFSSSGFLSALDRANVVQGQWRASGGIGQSSVSGRRNGNSLTLTLSSRDPKTGSQVESTILISLGGGGKRLSNTVRAVDPDTRQTYDVLTLTLRK